jgi:hypothetical protein
MCTACLMKGTDANDPVPIRSLSTQSPASGKLISKDQNTQRYPILLMFVVLQPVLRQSHLAKSSTVIAQACHTKNTSKPIEHSSAVIFAGRGMNS